MISSKNSASWYSGVPIIDTTGLTRLLSSCIFTKPYILPGLLPEGVNFFTVFGRSGLVFLQFLQSPIFSSQTWKTKYYKTMLIFIQSYI